MEGYGGSSRDRDLHLAIKFGVCQCQTQALNRKFYRWRRRRRGDYLRVRGTWKAVDINHKGNRKPSFLVYYKLYRRIVYRCAYQIQPLPANRYQVQCHNPVLGIRHRHLVLLLIHLRPSPTTEHLINPSTNILHLNFHLL